MQRQVKYKGKPLFGLDNEEINKHINEKERERNLTQTIHKIITTRKKEGHLPFCDTRENSEHRNGEVS